jgi:hypothetical protein
VDGGGINHAGPVGGGGGGEEDEDEGVLDASVRALVLKAGGGGEEGMALGYL